MTTDCSITNIGLSTGSGWRLIRKIPVWTGSSKAGTRGDIIRAASSPAAFSTMFSLSRELGFILQGFLLSLLFNVLILFIMDLFPSSPRGHWVEKWLFLVIEAPLLRSSLHLHLILSAQVRLILALQSKTSVLGASAGQTSAFLPELLVLPMLGERARAHPPPPTPCSVKAPPREENVEWERKALSFFSPECLFVAGTSYYRRKMKDSELFTMLLFISPPPPNLMPF